MKKLITTITFSNNDKIDIIKNKKYFFKKIIGTKKKKY